MESIVKHWHRLSREVVEWSPWTCSKDVDWAFKDMVSRGIGSAGLTVEVDL